MPGSNPFDEEEVGGIPQLLHLLKWALPKNKEKRKSVIRVLTLILTFITFAAFTCARGPTFVVKTRLVKDCNTTSIPPEFRKVVGMSASIPPDVATPDWCKEFNTLTDVEHVVGHKEAIYLGVCAICLYFSGVIADCYNPRYFISAGCIFGAFFCALFGLAQTWNIEDFQYFTMVYILSGAAQSTGWPVVFSCATHWYDGSRKGTFFAFWNVHQYLGSVLGLYIASIYIDGAWGNCFYIPAALLLIMAVLNLSLLVADPSDLFFLEQAKKTTNAPEGDVHLPAWLSTKQSINFIDALRLPGVMEYSACGFFTRPVGYIFLSWLPNFISLVKGISISITTSLSLGYMVGACFGGVVVGVLHDLFHKSAFLCCTCLLLSIPSIFLVSLKSLGDNMIRDTLLMVWIGFVVEAPYIVISTTVSAELGMHKLVKRDHRALATVGGIIRGTSTLGATVAPLVCAYFLKYSQWSHFVHLMVGAQFISIICLVRLTYHEHKKKDPIRFREYWRRNTVF